MFSYRHAFHAGNHADVLKHTTLVAILQYLVQKDAALTVIDTHAGAGLYRLDGDYAEKSGESADGIHRLIQAVKSPPAPARKGVDASKSIANGVAPALQAYLDLVAGFNTGSGPATVYPGSPFVVERMLRPQDRLKLYELHPTDGRTLEGNIAQLDAGRQIAVLREDGFNAVRKFLPPPSRRALLLCDPSYELKSDYARVLDLVAEGLKRFATGTYAIWYPVIARPEAHDMPRRLRTMANQAGKGWLHASLMLKSSKVTSAAVAADGVAKRPGLPGSGMFVVNPPFTLKAALAEALPQMVEALGQDRNAAFTLEAGG